jgi:RNA polymerase sigma factor FliA
MTPERSTSEDQLVRTHLQLANQAVNELARRLPSHVNRDDLSSAAMLGLAQAARSWDPARRLQQAGQAARSWDPDRGASFERHAATRIRGALLDELRDSDWASRSVRSRARRLQQAGEELTGRLGRAPTQAELAAELGTDAQTVHKLVGDVHRATVLNYESIVAEGEADDLLPSADRAPDHVLVDRSGGRTCPTPCSPCPSGSGPWSSATSTRSGPCWRSPASSGSPSRASPSSGPRP